MPLPDPGDLLFWIPQHPDPHDLDGAEFWATRGTVIRRVILPATLPDIFSGLHVELPVAIIVVMIGGYVGLGFYITIWSTRFAFANVHAAIFMIGICGFVLDQILLLVLRRIVYWQRKEA